MVEAGVSAAVALAGAAGAADSMTTGGLTIVATMTDEEGRNGAGAAPAAAAGVLLRETTALSAEPRSSAGTASARRGTTRRLLVASPLILGLRWRLLVLVEVLEDTMIAVTGVVVMSPEGATPEQGGMVPPRLLHRMAGPHQETTEGIMVGHHPAIAGADMASKATSTDPGCTT